VFCLIRLSSDPTQAKEYDETVVSAMRTNLLKPMDRMVTQYQSRTEEPAKEPTQQTRVDNAENGPLHGDLDYTLLVLPSSRPRRSAGVRVHVCWPQPKCIDD
jgi:hypothetical protein